MERGRLAAFRVSWSLVMAWMADGSRGKNRQAPGGIVRPPARPARLMSKIGRKNLMSTKEYERLKDLEDAYWGEMADLAVNMESVSKEDIEYLFDINRFRQL